MKRLCVFAGLFVAAIFGVFGTGAGEADQQSLSQVGQGPFGAYEPAIDVSFVGQLSDMLQSQTLQNGMTIEDNMWTEAYLERLGVRISYDWIAKSPDEYTQKLNVSLASGAIPDVLLLNQNSQLKRLYESEQIQEVGTAYDEYIWDEVVQDVISKGGEGAFLSSTFDGELFALPQIFSIPGEDSSSSFVWVRKDWLEAVDLGIPTTMDELLEVADAFVTQDPDGDGVDDTYGIALHRGLWGSTGGIEGFMNGFHAYPNIWVEQPDGTLAYGSTLPEVRTALEVAADLYASGVIDREFGVRPADKLPEEFAAGRAGILFGAQWMSLWPLGDSVQADPDADWLPLLLVSADDAPARPQAANAVNGWYAVNADFAYPEVVIKMANMFHNLAKYEFDEYSIIPDDETWTVWQLSPVVLSKPGKNQRIQKIIDDVYATGDTGLLAAAAPELEGELRSMYTNVSSYLEDGSRANWAWYRIFGPGGPGEVSQAGNRYYLAESLFLNDRFSGAATDTMVSKWSSLQSMQDEAFIKIIVGDLPPSAFDDFVTDWMELGGSDITREVNVWYDSVR
jgi:putative aldouronate transport system substrate-binding protein